MDFFTTTCQESPRNDKIFGICDDENGERAYTNVDDRTKWIATVKNNDKNKLVFTAVDKCIIKDFEEEGRGRCDGMLTSPEHLYFIELKNEAKSWIPDAVEQLKSTIKFFKENHDLKGIDIKKLLYVIKSTGVFKRSIMNLTFVFLGNMDLELIFKQK